AKVYACEACHFNLNLPYSLKEADLVLVVKRAEARKDAPPRGPEPPCDELSVEEVLKGDFKGERVRVRSFYGMCPDGIIVGEGTYVVILKKASDSDYEVSGDDAAAACGDALSRKAGLYVAVGGGCAARVLAVEDGSVEAEGRKLTLGEFRDRYGLWGGLGARPTEDGLFGAWRAGLFAWAGLPALYGVTQ
ncbi:MAG TPA: hypothetical protein VJ866_15740, partial [Pyrinomonadaceae bacterium]|nr:hypothetical protein [Pyrinomonadaceae bacterium]